MAQASEYNGQISYGDDVITRIVHSQRPGGRKELQQAVVRTISAVIEQVLDKGGVDRCQVSHMVAAGNTTMTHLLTGVNPKYIRMAPYVPAATFLPPVRADELGIDVCDHVHLYTFPCVSSYVGGDIVSGIIGSGVFQTDKVTLYVDIGTNGEAVVGNSEWLVATSCSAGPAFEGGGIRHGMRATRGAIEAVQIDPPPASRTSSPSASESRWASAARASSTRWPSCWKPASSARTASSTRIEAGEWLRRNEDGQWEYVLARAEYSGIGAGHRHHRTGHRQPDARQGRHLRRHHHAAEQRGHGPGRRGAGHRRGRLRQVPADGPGGGHRPLPGDGPRDASPSSATARCWARGWSPSPRTCWRRPRTSRAP